MTEQEVKTEEVAKVNPLERTLELVVSYATAEELTEKSLKGYAKNAKLPGFRKGHVPAAQVRRMYGAQAFDEAVNQLVGEAWAKAAKESELRIAGYPHIDAVPVEGDKDNMHFKATFEVFPDVEVPDFSEVELKRYVCPVTDAEVEKTIDVMRRQRATYEVVERAAKADDRVKLNFKGKKEGVEFQGGTAEGYVFVLGQGRMLPEFEAAVTGMAAGEKKTFPLTFPSDYGIKDLEGKEVEFDVEVIEVAEPAYPTIDDEFAKTLGVEGGVEAMRAEIRANLEREVKARLETKTKSEVMEAVAGVCKFAVPTGMVAEESEALRQQMSRDLAARGMDVKNMPQLPADMFKDQAERRVRLGLFVEALIQQEKISGTEDQVRAIASDIASSYEKPEEVVEYIMKDQNRVSNLRAQATENNVTEWVLGKAKTTEEVVEFDKLMAGQF
ncbi:MAG: trigger factor [Sutterella sp.]|nr:trigger factor [Sutterella sp.]MDY4163125.1 trigger factor [Sutterella sp.]